MSWATGRSRQPQNWNNLVVIDIGDGSSTEGGGEEIAIIDIVNSFNLNRISFGEKSYLYEVRGRKLSSTTFHYAGDRPLDICRLLALCLEPLEEVFQERRWDQRVSDQG